MADYKPTDLNVGVIDLFSILMPGALLTGGLVAAWGERPRPRLGALLDTAAAQWVAFAVGSYAFGHFAFLIAARIDYPAYDWYRRVRWPRKESDAYSVATILRRRYFGSAEGGDDDAPMNTFVWAKAMLVMYAPASAVIVDRYEADSKFFRSMIVVLPLVGLLLAARGWWLFAPVALLLSGLSFLLYAQRRHKSTQWAYQFAIVLMNDPARRESAPRAVPPAAPA